MGHGPRARKMNRRRAVLLLLPVVLLAGPWLLPAGAAGQEAPSPPGGGDRQGGRPIITMAVEGMITAGTADYGERVLARAQEEDAVLVIIRLNTPGGLVDATLRLVTAIMASPVPVVVHVAPGGSIAASAGSFLVTAAHIAAMAPGTTVGAAMPVTLSPDPNQPAQAADEKTIQFLAGHLRSIAQERGRPPETAQRFVTENLTLPAAEAVAAGMADLTAADQEELLAALAGRTVVTATGTVELDVTGAPVVPVETTFPNRVRSFLSNPQIAFILVLVGGLGIYLGFTSPGFYVPETLGALALLLGLYGLGLFATSGLALALLALGFILILAEAFTPGFGVLGIAGAAALLLGLFLLPQEPLLPVDWFGTFRALALVVVAAAVLLVIAVTTALWRTRRGRADDLTLWESRGVVVQELAPEGLVKVGGELWRARSADGQVLPAGVAVQVLARKGLLLTVGPVAQETAGRETAPGSAPATGPQATNKESQDDHP